MEMSKHDLRISSLRKTFDFEKPEKVPVYMQFTTWPYAYAGVKLADVIDDPVKNAEAYTKFLDDIDIDVTLFGVYEIPVRATEALGSEKYLIETDGVGVIHNQAAESYLDESFYPQIIADPNAVKMNHLARKWAPGLDQGKEIAKEHIRQAIQPYLADAAFKQIAMGKFIEKEILCVIMGGAPFYTGPFTQIFDFFRGMKNALIDLRRRPQLVKDACDSIMQQYAEATHMAKNMEEAKQQLAGIEMPMGINIINAECFLSPKQFESLYFEPFKKYYGPYFEAGAKYFILGEGKLMQSLEMYNDLPKGSVAIMLDEDDPYVAHKIIKGNQVLIAGADINTLKCGTEQETLDCVKKAFDTFAPDGGYIFGNNKVLVCENDVQISNLKAAYALADELSRQ